MTPELLSRQTRQTRLALMLISFAAVLLCQFEGNLNGDIRLFGASITIDEIAFYWALPFLTGYLLFSFALSAFSDRKRAGQSPKEQALSEQLRRLNEQQTLDERRAQQKIVTLIRTLRPEYEGAVNWLNRAYEDEVVHANLVDVIQDTYSAAVSDGMSRNSQLKEAIQKLEMLAHLSMRVHDIHTRYTTNKSKAMATLVYGKTQEEAEEFSAKQMREDSQKLQTATRMSDRMRKIGEEITAAINEEFLISEIHGESKNRLVHDLDMAIQDHQFHLAPQRTLSWIKDTLFDIAIPTVIGISGFTASILLLLREI